MAILMMTLVSGTSPVIWQAVGTAGISGQCRQIGINVSRFCLYHSHTSCGPHHNATVIK